LDTGYEMTSRETDLRHPLGPSGPSNPESSWGGCDAGGMERIRDRSAGLRATTIDREMQLVREAIAMVASGGARRVVVAGIGLGELLFEPGSRLAVEAGVRLTRLATADGSGADLVVERINE